MAKLFPFRPSEAPEVESEPRLVDIDDAAADDVFAALSAETAREILSRLYEDPATASDVADAADTSLQNARYHLDKLQSAGLIEAVDTWYSSRGTEMTVYAPTSEPLVVAAGEEESRSVLRSALKRIVGAVGVLGVASVAVDRLAQRLDPELPATGGGPSFTGGVETALETATPTASAESVGVATQTQTEKATRTSTFAERSGETLTGTEEPTTTTVVADAAGNASETVAPSSGQLEATRAAVEEATRTAAAGSSGVDVGAIPPGLAFFVGGLFAVALAAGWWYWFGYRPMYGD